MQRPTRLRLSCFRLAQSLPLVRIRCPRLSRFWPQSGDQPDHFWKEAREASSQIKHLASRTRTGFQRFTDRVSDPAFRLTFLRFATPLFASFQVASVPVRPFGSTTASRIAPVAAASLPGARCTSTT
jgi:hypothetical protein